MLRMRVIAIIVDDKRKLMGYKIMNLGTGITMAIPANKTDFKRYIDHPVLGSWSEKYNWRIVEHVENLVEIDGEYKTRDCSYERYPIFDLNGLLIENNRASVIKQFIRDGEVEGYQLVDGYGRIVKLTKEKTIQLLEKVGGVNVKLVTRGNNKIVSAIHGNIPTVELLETREVEAKRKLLNARFTRPTDKNRYLGKRGVYRGTILGYDTFYDMDFPNRKVANRHRNKLEYNIYTYRLGKRTAKHYEYTVYEINRKICDKNNIPYKKQLSIIQSKDVLTHEELLSDNILSALKKDLALYGLTSVLKQIKNGNMQQEIKDIISKLAKTEVYDVEFINYCSALSDSLNRYGTNGNEIAIHNYLLALIDLNKERFKYLSDYIESIRNRVKTNKSSFRPSDESIINEINVHDGGKICIDEDTNTVNYINGDTTIEIVEDLGENRFDFGYKPAGFYELSKGIYNVLVVDTYSNRYKSRKTNTYKRIRIQKNNIRYGSKKFTDGELITTAKGKWVVAMNNIKSRKQEYLEVKVWRFDSNELVCNQFKSKAMKVYKYEIHMSKQEILTKIKERLK